MVDELLDGFGGHDRREIAFAPLLLLLLLLLLMMMMMLLLLLLGFRDG